VNESKMKIKTHIGNESDSMINPFKQNESGLETKTKSFNESD
jgi:hypothetical protein